MTDELPGNKMISPKPVQQIGPFFVYIYESKGDVKHWNTQVSIFFRDEKTPPHRQRRADDVLAYAFAIVLACSIIAGIVILALTMRDIWTAGW